MIGLLGVDLAGRRVLVAGGGPVAARRLPELVAAGADILVVAPYACEDIAEITADNPDSVTLRLREVAAADLDGCWLVHVATGDPAIDQAVATWAEQRRIFCVNAGKATAGTARTPATTRAGDILIGVITSGFGVADDRTARRPTGDPRRVAAVRDGIADLLAQGRFDLRRRRPGTGRVILVGGGPGAPDLVTVRGRQAIAEADVVVTDRLGPVSILPGLAAGVEVIDVGKTPGHHPVPQHRINGILIEQAQQGRTVVRLKGGDPFVLGRGAEEVSACRTAGIDVEVIPGVSSALSVPALAGIPVTHRGTATSFHVTTGHNGLDDAALAAARQPQTTLVVLMGVSALPILVDQTLAAGVLPTTPVAIVENGSTPQQRIVRGRLIDIVATAATADVRAPAIIVIGDVARPDLIPDLVPGSVHG